MAFIAGAPVADSLGCVCGGEQGWIQFGPNHVTYCNACHRLRSRPLVDPRVPRHQDHVKALQEEILVEEEEARNDGRLLKCIIESGVHAPHGSTVQVQIMHGDPRWLVKGSRVEGCHADAKRSSENQTMAKVVKKGGSVLELEVDDPAWADVPRGHGVELTPQTSATLHRNLLKAYLVVSRHGTDLDPDGLPEVGEVAGNERGLRPRQATALRRCLANPDGGVVLVQGPPGTGKTFVIARFISEAVRRGETVLVTSHTHVAIDNALRKAVKGDRKLAEKMVRLGDSGSVAPDLLPWNAPIGKFHMDPEDEDSLPLFRSVFEKRPVVGMTLDALACAFVHVDNMDQPFERFDHVIVDEAGMNAFPKLAIARAAGKRLVLVGDPLQLPPIIRAWSYRNDEHYKRSHFELLQMMRPDLSVMLDEQFRSHDGIYAWSNGAVYDDAVTTRSSPGELRWRGNGPVVWIDTRGTPGNRAERVGTSRVNPTHVAVALDVCRDLIGAGTPPEEIGFISPFRAQADAFREAAAAHKQAHVLARITASTVDAFQGNERRAIIYDLTTLKPGRPHQDHRRLNVSLTRAQELLVLLGPRDFVRDWSENPFHRSLQQWAQPVVVSQLELAR